MHMATMVMVKIVIMHFDENQPFAKISRITCTVDGHTLQAQAVSSIDHIILFAVNWYALCQFTGQEVFHLQSVVLIVPQ